MYCDVVDETIVYQYKKIIKEIRLSHGEQWENSNQLCSLCTDRGLFAGIMVELRIVFI
jgi:hypothetical protein